MKDTVIDSVFKLNAKRDWLQSQSKGCNKQKDQYVSNFGNDCMFCCLPLQTRDEAMASFQAKMKKEKKKVEDNKKV